MKDIATLVVILLTFFQSNSQSSFVWQNPKPQGNSLYSTYFINTSTGYTAGLNGTILKTTDGGLNWAKQNSGTTASLNSIFFINQNTGWACGANTLLKTTDGGNTWIILTSSAPTALTSVFFFNSTTGIISGWGQILRTTDGGNTLTSVAGGTMVNFSNMMSVYFVDNDHGWSVGTNGKILHTSNAGTTWSAQASPTTNRLNSIYFIDTLNGYIFGDYGTRLRTIDGGNTWTFQKVMNNHINSTWFINADTGFAATESNSDSTTLYKTTNGGLIWSSYWSGSERALTSICFANTTTGWAVGHSGRIVWTNNAGQTWNSTSSGLTTPLLSVHFISPDRGWAVGEQGGMVKTIDGGNQWMDSKIPGTGYVNGVYFMNKDTGIIVAGFGNKQIYRTYNGGGTWTEAQTPNYSYFLNSITFGGSKGWAAGLNGKILLTIDKGATWAEQNSGTNNDLYCIHFPKTDTALGLSLGKNDTLGYLVGDGGLIMKTINGGGNWYQQTSGTAQRLNTIFFFDSINGWCAGQGGTILRTKNGGTSWEKLTSTITNSIYGIQFIDSKIGYAVADYGIILKTNDGGDTWTTLPSGTANRLYSLWFTDSKTGYVVGTYGTILKTTNGGSTFVAADYSKKPSLNVFPNPTTSQLFIEWTGKPNSYEFMNLQGQVLVVGRLIETGPTSLDLSNIAPGIYLLKTDESIIKIIKY